MFESFDNVMPLWSVDWYKPINANVSFFYRDPFFTANFELTFEIVYENQKIKNKGLSTKLMLILYELNAAESNKGCQELKPRFCY